MKERLNLFKEDPTYIYPVEDIQVHVQLKSDVVDHMAQLDPDPFWVNNRNQIISESILTPKGSEYKMETLSQKLEELRENGVTSNFFHQLKKVRDDFRLLGRFL